MVIAKAYDVSHVRFDVPDLDVMRRFLTDFGMTEVPAEAERLYMRGSGGLPFLHVCQQAPEPKFAGLGFWMKSVDDLRSLADHDGLTVEDLQTPGGGKIVRLTDPDGFSVEAVAGQKLAEPLPVPQHQAWNHGGVYPRQGEWRRVARGASHVRRLGHVVLSVSSYATSEVWYKERFGLVISDEIQPEENHAIGAFLRCDRGDEPCDHHTIFLLEQPKPPEFMHAAYEVTDLDDLMAGHDHLKKGGYDHQWGIGRHHLGSQVFDYWRDPYGNEIEHWTDGDQLVTAQGGGIAGLEELLGVQWGMVMPAMPPEH